MQESATDMLMHCFWPCTEIGSGLVVFLDVLVSVFDVSVVSVVLSNSYLTNELRSCRCFVRFSTIGGRTTAELAHRDAAKKQFMYH